MSMQLFVNGLAVWTPGMTDWPQAVAVLNGVVAFDPQAGVWPAPAVLSSAERRRAPVTVKMAVQVAHDACNMAGADPGQLPCVFASSHGDLDISDYMCEELAQAQPALSPTRFHNSVHNAASGYWTIAVGCMQPANAISAGADSFASGLLETAALCMDAGQALLVAYDMAAPAKLLPLCPISQSFAVAMVLGNTHAANSLAMVSTTDSPVTGSSLPAELAALLSANPAARALPWLHAIATHTPATVSLAGAHWKVTPCQ